MTTMGSVLLRFLATISLALIVALFGPLAMLGWLLTSVTLPVVEWAMSKLGVWPDES